MAKAKISPMKPVKMKVIQQSAVGLDAFDGAVKVCARYGPGKTSGKNRCLQWMAGPGYAEGPADRGDGKSNPQYFVEAARRDEQGRPFRRYRYRSGNKPLPYPPRTILNKAGKEVFNPKSGITQDSWKELPDDVKLQIISIVQKGTIKPLQPEELLLVPGPVTVKVEPKK
jgi:hypothetical protein